MKEQKDDAHFAVSLDGITLSDDQLERIDKGIKEVVLRELAQTDHHGDLVINSKLDQNPRFKSLQRPILFGLWVERHELFHDRIRNGVHE